MMRLLLYAVVAGTFLKARAGIVEQTCGQFSKAQLTCNYVCRVNYLEKIKAPAMAVMSEFNDRDETFRKCFKSNGGPGCETVEYVDGKAKSVKVDREYVKTRLFGPPGERDKNFKEMRKNLALRYNENEFGAGVGDWNMFASDDRSTAEKKVRKNIVHPASDGAKIKPLTEAELGDAAAVWDEEFAVNFYEFSKKNPGDECATLEKFRSSKRGDLQVSLRKKGDKGYTELLNRHPLYRYITDPDNLDEEIPGILEKVSKNNADIGKKYDNYHPSRRGPFDSTKAYTIHAMGTERYFMDVAKASAQVGPAGQKAFNSTVVLEACQGAMEMNRLIESSAAWKQNTFMVSAIVGGVGFIAAAGCGFVAGAATVGSAAVPAAAYCGGTAGAAIAGTMMLGGATVGTINAVGYGVGEASQVRDLTKLTGSSSTGGLVEQAELGKVQAQQNDSVEQGVMSAASVTGLNVVSQGKGAVQLGASVRNAGAWAGNSARRAISGAEQVKPISETANLGQFEARKLAAERAARTAERAAAETEKTARAAAVVAAQEKASTQLRDRRSGASLSDRSPAMVSPGGGEAVTSAQMKAAEASLGKMGFQSNGLDEAVARGKAFELKPVEQPPKGAAEWVLNRQIRQVKQDGPELRVVVDESKFAHPDDVDSAAYFSRKDNTIFLRPSTLAKGTDRIEETIAHELSHARNMHLCDKYGGIYCTRLIYVEAEQGSKPVGVGPGRDSYRGGFDSDEYNAWRAQGRVQKNVPDGVVPAGEVAREFVDTQLEYLKAARKSVAEGRGRIPLSLGQTKIRVKLKDGRSLDVRLPFQATYATQEEARRHIVEILDARILSLSPSQGKKATKVIRTGKPLAVSNPSHKPGLSSNGQVITKSGDPLVTFGDVVDLPMVAKNEKMLGLGFFHSRRDEMVNKIEVNLERLGLREYKPKNHPALDRFMAKVSDETGRKVSIYTDFRSPGFKSKYSGTMGDIHESIESVVSRAPNQQAIAFNLTGIDPKKIGTQWSYTTAELAILFSEPRYFNAVRWYERGRQLSSQEVYSRFAPYREKLKSILDYIAITSD